MKGSKQFAVVDKRAGNDYLHRFALVAIYAESLLCAGRTTLRLFVSATATETIQIKPRYLVIGMKKFAGSGYIFEQFGS
jgi:hypothetical protein